MGRELLCTVRSGGKMSSGKALLETDEIVFRGDVRLKIPLASIQSASSQDGKLRLRWTGGEAVFELGDNAEKWAHKILHHKQRSEKLGIKPNMLISALAIGDSDFVAEVRTQAKTFCDSKPLRNSDLIFLGAETVGELGRVGNLASSLSSGGALWIVYPKGKQEIKELQVLDAGRRAGLVDVKVVKFSATHTALKFVRRKAKGVHEK